MLYVTAQVLGVISWIIFLLSYYSKRINKVLFMQIVASILDCLCYALLGAWTGLLISVFELIKGFGYYKTDKDKYIFIFTIPIYIIIGLVSERTIFTIIPIAASLIDGYAVLRSEKTAVKGGVISNFLWMIYDLSYLDFAGVLSDLTLVISNIFIITYGYTKYLHRNSVYTVMGKYISKNTMKELYKLDKSYYDEYLLWEEDKMRKLYNAEKNSYILIKYKNIIIGYINILSINEALYNYILQYNDLYDNYDVKDLVPYENKGEYFININSIVLKSEYQNKDTVEKIIKEINKYINIRNKKGFKIKKACSYAVTSFEEELLKKMEFNKCKNITNEIFLYTKDMN